MQIGYDIYGYALESKLVLQPAEDAAIGPEPDGNGFAMLSEFVADMRSTCMKLARFQGETILGQSVIDNPVARERAIDLKDWDCHMNAENEIDAATGDVILRTLCGADCYLRTIANREPTAVLLKRVADAVSAAYSE
jgi:hypothetical protein